MRMLGLTRVIYIGAGLIKLRSAERRLDKAWRQLDPLPVLERIPAMYTLVKTLDLILDRRRILCGDPLPRGGGSKQTSRMIELEPQSIPADAMPEAAQPEPGASLD